MFDECVSSQFKVEPTTKQFMLKIKTHPWFDKMNYSTLMKKLMRNSLCCNFQGK